MSKQKSLLIGIGIIAALVIGFLIGLSVDYPRLNKRVVSGTIGKVNNYRNSKVSEADIHLKNELLADTTKLKMLKGYFNFYYVGAIKMSSDVDVAVKEALAVDAFQARNKTLTGNIETYGKFLLSARTNLLLALVACKSVREADPIQLRNTLNQGRNVVAQINYRNRVVLDFVDALSTFIKSNKQGQYQGLEKAHDLLVANQIYTAMITNNKAVLKYLDKTTFFAKSRENVKSIDQQKLSMMIHLDMEKLGQYKMNDAEKLMNDDAEKLKGGDAEKLKGGDAEKLKSSDAEKLGHYIMDSEKLGIYGDAAKLGQVAGDAEKLGKALFKDTEKLRCDVEKLGAFYTDKLSLFIQNDAEKLSHFPVILDAEKLGIE